MSLTDVEQPFILVTSKRQKSKNNNKRFCTERSNIQNRSLGLFDDDENEKSFDKPVELKKITDCTLKILNSDYFKQTIKILFEELTSPASTINKLVCFGIGKIRNCYIARHQLGYILALKSYFQINSIQFHEPLFNQHDIELISALNCEVFQANIEGKLELDSSRRTLVYLPHCPKQLTNNLLWKNWSSDALHQLVLICNSFQFIIQQTPNSDLSRDASFISRIEKYTREICLKNSFEPNNIFNDIAVHSFDVKNCDKNFFDKCSEPAYSLSELIEATEKLCV